MCILMQKRRNFISFCGIHDVILTMFNWIHDIILFIVVYQRINSGYFSLLLNIGKKNNVMLEFNLKLVVFPLYKLIYVFLLTLDTDVNHWARVESVPGWMWRMDLSSCNMQSKIESKADFKITPFWQTFNSR